MAGQPSADEGPDRARMRRGQSRHDATVIRETDLMRNGVPARLEDVSTAGLRLRTQAALQESDQLKVNVRNEMQRFDKEVRGVVRRVERMGDGELSVGVDLYTRLTPQEVAVLRAGINSDADSDGPMWV